MKVKQAKELASRVASRVLENNKDQVKRLAAEMIVKGPASTPEEESAIQLVFDEYCRLQADILRKI